MPGRRLAVAVSAALFASLSCTVPLAAGAASLPSLECKARTTPVPTGPATLVSDKVLPKTGGRLHDVTLASPALGSHVEVYVLLPKDYSPDPKHRYHVLYLLHGSGGSQVDWTMHGAQQLLDQAAPKAHLPSTIVVMPDGGLEGYYTDWYGTDVDNPAEKVAPGWATFDIHELIPYVDARYPTIASGRGRAIAGLSMGGFGATSLAARNPGMFSVVGSFSGADDLDLSAPYEAIVLEGTSPAFTYGAPDLCIWGDPITHRIGAEAVDPTYLAPDLEGTHLYLATGNGTPGPLDDLSTPTGIATAGGGAAVELDVSQMNAGFVTALNAARVPHTDYFYGPGTHSWPYWERDLTRFVPFVARGWRHPDPAPRSFSDRSAATDFTAWGWSFVSDRPVEEFTYLHNVSKRGLEVAGSGTLRIVTAALYSPGSAWVVNGKRVLASPSGRLRFSLSLPDPASQQSSFPPGSAIPAGWTWRQVGITAAAS